MMLQQAEAASLLNRLVGGSTSNEARIMLLERRLTGSIVPSLNDGSISVAPQNLENGFDAVANEHVSHALGQSPQPLSAHAPSDKFVRSVSTAHQEDMAAGAKNTAAKRRKMESIKSPGDLSNTEYASPVVGGPPALLLLNTPTTRVTAASSVQPGVLAGRQSPQVGKAGSGGTTTTTSTKGSGGKASAGNHRGQTKVNTYFPSVDGNSRDSECSGPSAAERAAAAAAAALQGSGPMLSSTSHQLQAQHQSIAISRLSPVPEVVHDERLATCQQQLEAREEELRALKEKLRIQEEHLAVQARSTAEEVSSLLKTNERLAKQAEEVSSLLKTNERLAKQAEDTARVSADRESKLKTEMMRVLRNGVRCERELQRLILSTGASRLGGVAVQRSGPMQVQEVWEDGQAHQQVALKLQALAAQREEVEAARKALRKKLAPPPSSARNQQQQQQQQIDDPSTSSKQTGQQEEFMSGTEFVTMDEIYKLRVTSLKREEEAARAEEERLNAEKQKHIRMLKRVRDEDSSRFNSMGVLAKRYQLLGLLGKGGFSEVFKAYDLVELRHVACKIHQLNPHWNEPKKQSYVKHAVREYEIHKALTHPHIVGLLDILEIDNASFATILDLCEGPDLDTVLREHGTLPEKEARAIIAQVFSALVHLNQPRHRIIHYDLKPANILFDTLGLAKVTDFGLSKVVDEGQTLGMELTSQGAGTYWYLPPECFEMSAAGQAPRISNKVDVWSAGVILYQMLWGKRPFGEGMSQEQIMRDRVMLNAREVEFPSKPSVSSEAKEFIRKCLAYRQEVRWDVLTASQDPYLCLTKSSAAAAAAAATAAAVASGSSSSLMAGQPSGGYQLQQPAGSMAMNGALASAGSNSYNTKRAAATGFGSLLKSSPVLDQL
ncbi:hypothetical protein CEUSTIGMA_g3828.t1 [Chlamydomonas eustigma]|uniref:Protein kinase domain-containing protein n=1 Tax=Chlamydomonas eustigma TaxID=1157962 RepID=A0A250X0G2_9CHLO|nr:hypothetical protein CEUSTIGMA_g3828.t1 [Chlamydomonas eustigma]|eukprot:GAX76382.1 hypothetical protein CEUSTIGMA_g3828.t1 [Chlamydomonas eustigma]